MADKLFGIDISRQILQDEDEIYVQPVSSRRHLGKQESAEVSIPTLDSEHSYIDSSLSESFAGTVYNNHLFEFITGEDEHLHYIGHELDGENIEMPKNCKIYRKLFKGTNIVISPVIEDGVVDCREMLADCINLSNAPIIPESVDDTYNICAGCKPNVVLQCDWNIEHRGVPKSWSTQNLSNGRDFHHDDSINDVTNEHKGATL